MKKAIKWGVVYVAFAPFLAAFFFSAILLLAPFFAGNLSLTSPLEELHAHIQSTLGLSFIALFVSFTYFGLPAFLIGAACGTWAIRRGVPPFILPPTVACMAFMPVAYYLSGSVPDQHKGYLGRDLILLGFGLFLIASQILWFKLKRGELQDK